MGTRFIFDRKLKEEQDLFSEIYRLTSKKPYPTKDVTHLATFIDSCFYVMTEEKYAKDRRRRERQQSEKERERKKLQEKIEKERMEKLALQAPEPLPELLEAPIPAEIPLLEISPDESLPGLDFETELPPIDAPAPKEAIKKEYMLNLYGAPIGILVEKNILGDYVYSVVEPVLDLNVVTKAKELFGRDLESNNTLFDNNDFMVRIAEKTAKKTKEHFSSMLVSKLKYYLSRNMLGAYSFDPFLYDDNVQAIYCEGINKPIRVEYEDLGKIETNKTLFDNTEINSVIQKIGNATGSIINEQNPILNVTFQGLHFEGVMGVGGASSTLTIRRIE